MAGQFSTPKVVAEITDDDAEPQRQDGLAQFVRAQPVDGHVEGRDGEKDRRRGLDALDGMVEALEEQVIKAGKPFLGICVGMQLMASMGREHQNTPGLNWLEGEVVALDSSDKTLKIPHMGWNNLEFHAPLHPIFEEIPVDAHVYFVHSYGFSPADPKHVLASVDYGGQTTAAG